MKETLFFILVLVFVFSACSKESEPETVLDVVVPAPVAEPEPEPAPIEQEFGLLNYMEWLELHPEETPPFDIELDWLICSIARDDGYITETVLFPKQWPAKQLGNSIPEYTGTGYIQELFITHPNMSLRTEDIEKIKLSVYKYKDEDINKYIDNLSGFTPDEELAEEYYRNEIESSPFMHSVQSFRKDGVVLNIVFAEDVEVFLNNGKFVQFEVIFSRDAYKFDPDITEPTELLNFFEYAALMEFEVPADAEIRLDYLMDTFDGSGIHYDLINAPSKWPRHAFGDLLPVYTSFGFLQRYEITTPQNDTSPENALLLAVYITTNDDADIEAYVRRVSDFGYYELPPEEYGKIEKDIAIERDFLRVFCLPGHKCIISTFLDTNLPTLSITLFFEGRNQNFLQAQSSSE